MPISQSLDATMVLFNSSRVKVKRGIFCQLFKFIRGTRPGSRARAPGRRLIPGPSARARRAACRGRRSQIMITQRAAAAAGTWTVTVTVTVTVRVTVTVTVTSTTEYLRMPRSADHVRVMIGLEYPRMPRFG